MANPNPSPATRISKGTTLNPGGRVQAAWLRELLEAANDRTTEGKTHREAVFFHRLDIATRTGRGADASPKESNEAASLLWAYYMGKPVDSLDINNPDGSLGPRVLAYIPSNGRVPGREPEGEAVATEPAQPAPEAPPASDDGRSSADH